MARQSLLSPDSWGQPQLVAIGGQLAGLAVKGTDAKLVQPGTQQVEPVPETAPPQGEQAWQSFPAQGTQPVPTWLPTFPRCHPALSPPPRSAPGQCPKLLVQGRDAISPSPLSAQALGAPHYEQPRSPRKSKLGMRATRTPKCPHLLSGLWSWEDSTLRHPGSPQLPHLPTVPGHWDRIPACGARGSMGVPPAPVLGSLEGLQNWVTAGSLHSR